MSFTHQGASWFDAWYTAVEGLPFPYNASDWPSDAPADREDEYSKSTTADAVARSFNSAERFKDKYDVPVWVGEFGATVFGDEDARAEYAKAARESMEDKGLAWAWWDYNAAFGIFKWGQSSKSIYYGAIYDKLLRRGLGLNPPVQSELPVLVKSESFDIYTDGVSDDITPRVSSGRIDLDMLATDQVASGTYSISFVHDTNRTSGGYGSMTYRFKGHCADFSDNLDNFSLEFKVLSQPGNRFTIRIKDTNSKRRNMVISETATPDDHPANNSFVVGAWGDDWKTVSIPLSSFNFTTGDNPVDPSRILLFDFYLDRKEKVGDEYEKFVMIGTLYFDDIKFVYTEPDDE